MNRALKYSLFGVWALRLLLGGLAVRLVRFLREHDPCGEVVAELRKMQEERATEP